METNNCNTDLQVVSQEYPYEEESLQTKTKKLLKHLSPRDIWKLKSLIIGLLVACFLYVTYLTNFSFALPAIIVLIMTVELGCRLLAGKEKRGMRLESGIFMTTSLLQGLQISLWGLHDSWESAQILCLHASFLLYLMARTGQSSQDRLGIIVWIDLIYTSCLFPLKYFFLGVFTLPYKTRPKQELSIEERHNRQLHKGMILVSIFVALILTVFAASQLSQVLPAFGQLWKQVFQTLATLFNFNIHFENSGLIIFRFLSSIPLALGLFAQLAAVYLAKDKPLSQTQLETSLKKTRLFPKLAAYIVIGSLCFTYALFLLTATSQVGELLSLNQINIPAHQASHMAVQGFWQLVRVSILNFGVLAGLYLYSKENIFNHKGLRRISTLLFTFTSLFALIASWKLFGVYIALYGITPRRLLSGWFVTVLFVWCILTLIRLYKPIQTTRLAIFYATISFTLVSLLGSFIL